MKEYFHASGIILAVSAINLLAEPFLGYRAVGFLFLVTIIFLSTFLKGHALVFSAVLSTFIWNFFFITPKFTFFIHDSGDIMMVFTYFFAAIVGGVLTTRIKRQEQELLALKLKEDSRKLHETLLNSISHEMRTPLTVLIGSASALHEAEIFKNEASRATLISEIVRSGQRLNRVVENLLDLSRLERGDVRIKKEWFSWDELIHELRTYMEEDLKEAFLELMGNGSCYLEGDLTLLVHAFSNLISNSIIHSGRTPTITIEIKKSKNLYWISYGDDGRGISNEMGDHIFEKFYQSAEVHGKGVGLGLAIVKNIIELHGGTIKLGANNPGATFFITLPRKKSPFNFDDEGEA